VFGALLLVTAVAYVRRWAGRPVLVLWGLVWLAGIGAAASPDTTTQLANLVGIQRGTDLVLYCATVGMFVGFFLMYVRLRRVRRDITILARRIAMMEPVERPPREPHPAPPRTRTQTEHPDAER
jgi:hypothetical protein